MRLMVRPEIRESMLGAMELVNGAIFCRSPTLNSELDHKDIPAPHNENTNERVTQKQGSPIVISR